MPQVLSLSLRPKTFSQMVGANKLIEKIRGHYENKRMPQAWMFVGQTGCGKTTIARILSVALQCPHQEQFGDPCIECRRNKGKFDIMEVNASEVTGKMAIEDVISGYKYNPRPGNKCRVYILDEAHKLSDSAQNLLLKAFEDCPKTTVWIVNTTQPDKIIRTLRSRCVTYTVPSFGITETTELVQKAIKVSGGDKSSDDLAEELLSAGVTSPRLILMAVEKYLAGADAEEAARVELSTEFDVRLLSTAVKRGDWNKAVKHLSKVSVEDTMLVRAAMSNYLKTILLNEGPKTERGNLVAWGIRQLAKATAPEDSLKLPILVETIHRMCKAYADNKI